MPLMTVEVDLQVEICWVCGLTFAMSKRWSEVRRERGESFHCPAGCLLRYGKSEVEQLEEKLSAAESRIQYRNETINRMQKSAYAQKGVLTKLKNRVAAGVCPRCHRTFKQLSEHMKTKHPEYPPKE